ncbi:UDP-N-acetylmuramoyl-L-alanyl-D-glutamate--2,6-diaminopimelate ligase [Insolitispirillum peregrinum]|uniref:Multifunctional fusion protein n=1 Tax=Insolitispirillum peregrinum TaxID=80876 RepID=A0A1N7LPB5_9PROT|nr:UDP-N-acetylmuramoyl-L-alanyl-D-glutamate--2,6-diaminopimelate ligase [Insolitispirillum peregrinum]SIS75686.1 UDP-N-acetylmuramoylalanyl-D-glutamate--2,6-diaminopimelate ligase /UDP-N-acetylmuramoyl-tripeptide--D-alanyl-D-alanine ligase [Insolitispirillum peregrinum]
MRLLADLIAPFVASGELRVLHGSPEATTITGMTADSRAVQRGFLFIAIPGTKSDGRSFVPAALSAGATALLVPDDDQPLDCACPEDVVVLATPSVRLALSRLAAAFFPAQPATITAVTGTNGKTSTACFTRALWEHLGHSAGSLGTLGLASRALSIGGSHTTPDPVHLHGILSDVAAAGVTHLCMEASSHGLDQFRLDGVRLTAAAFTNLTRDHLDYHLTLDAYLAAKTRLFTEVLPVGGSAVLNADIPEFAALKAATEAAGRRVIGYGTQAEEIRLLERTPTPHGQQLHLRVFGSDYRLTLPLAGAFQAANALAALGLVIASGAPVAAAVAALEHLPGVPGRLEQVGSHNGASVFVDYAHTPDALEVVLTALRPHARNRLVVVFGCGGDRDRGKRPVMGEIAARLADEVIVTDDNPRSEVPSAIRAEVMAGCPFAREIGDRHQAIATAVADLQPGDVLLIAGKGHESGQTVAGVVTPFDDRIEARKAIIALSPLWTASEIAAATNGQCAGEFVCHGVSIDSRTVAAGDLFIAIAGPSHDGHDWVAAALAAGAAGAVVHRPIDGVDPARLVLVTDTFTALQDLGRAGRDRFGGRVVGVTGSVGKTSTKEMLARVLSAIAPTHAAVGSFNNHWGVPLTLARLPRQMAYAVIEMGMNHPDEIRPLTTIARPHVAVITTIASAHIEHLGSLEAIAEAKAEIFDGVCQPGGVVVLPTDAPCADRLVERAGQHQLIIRRFGCADNADIRLGDATICHDHTAVLALIDGREVHYSIGAAGRHWAMNSLAVLAAVQAVCAPALSFSDIFPTVAQSLAGMQPPKGRGQRHTVPLAAGGAPLVVIDEAYNANPDSLAAALAALGASGGASGGTSQGTTQGRRIVVVGDMLELGPAGPALHAGMAPAVLAAGADLVFTAGPLSEQLFNAVPAAVRGQHAATSADLAPLVAAAVRPGDVVMVKGSAGSRMGLVVAALLALAA